MELRLLRSFLAVADHLSFRKAAQQLHLTQPALSVQIKQLEKSIGAPLLTRDTHHVQLTHAGEFLYEKAVRLLNDAQAIEEQTRQAAQGERGTLSLGYTESAMASFLPSLLRDLSDHLPHIQLQLQQQHSEHLAREVALQRLDAAIISLWQKMPQLRSTPIAQEALGAVLPDGHALQDKQQVTLRQLSGETYILFPYQDNPSLYSEIISSCREAGFAPRLGEETQSRILAVNMVKAGLGITFLSENLAYYCSAGTVFKPLRRPRPQLRYHLVEPVKGGNPCVGELKKLLKIG